MLTTRAGGHTHRGKGKDEGIKKRGESAEFNIAFCFCCVSHASSAVLLFFFTSVLLTDPHLTFNLLSILQGWLSFNKMTIPVSMPVHLRVTLTPEKSTSFDPIFLLSYSYFIFIQI